MLKIYKTISILLTLIFLSFPRSPELIAPCPYDALRPQATFERDTLNGISGFTFGEPQGICLGVNKANVTFQKEGRFTKGWIVELQPSVVECDVWVDPAMVGYDFYAWASTRKLAAETGRTYVPLPGKTVPQFKHELPEEDRNRVILVGPATQGGFWGANTIVKKRYELIKKTARGLYQSRKVQPEGDFYFLVLDPGKIDVRKIKMKKGAPQEDMNDINLAFVGPPLWYRGKDLSDRIRLPKTKDPKTKKEKKAPLRNGYHVNWPPQETITSFIIWGCNRKTGVVYYFPMVRVGSQEINGVTIKEMLEGFKAYAAKRNIDMKDVDLILGPGGVDTNVILPDEELTSTEDPRSKTAGDYPAGRPLGTIFYVLAKKEEEGLHPPRLDLVQAANRAYYKFLGEKDTIGFNTEETITDYNARATAIELYNHLRELKARGRLPPKIVLQEWGIGKSMFMQDFMIEFLGVDIHREFMDVFEYQGYDISSALLHHAQAVLDNCDKDERHPSLYSLTHFRGKAKFTQIDLMERLPDSDVKPIWIRFEELYDDFGEVYFVERQGGQWFLVESWPVMNKPCVIKCTDGTTVDFKMFLSEYFFALDSSRLQQIANLHEILPLIEYEERIVPMPAELQSNEYVGAYLAHIEAGVKDGVRMPLNVGAAKNLCAVVDLLDKERGGVLQFFDYGFCEDYPVKGDKLASYEKGGGGWLTAALNFDFLAFVLKRKHPEAVLQISGQMDYQTGILGKLSHPDLEVNYKNLYQVKVIQVPRSQRTIQPLSAARKRYRPEEILAEGI